jgi:hypothetical protein
MKPVGTIAFISTCPARRWGMTEIERLEEQASRAERLAESVVDRLTLERLRSFAGERRTRLDLLLGQSQLSRSEGQAGG